MSLKIVTLNVRGLRDRVARRCLFAFLRDQKFDIAFLQETHSIESDYRIWRSEWGAECILSHGTENSCGVAIFFKRHLGVSILETKLDDHGRFIYVRASFSNKVFHLVNVYAPDFSVGARVEFFERIGSEIFRAYLSGDSAPVFLGGDFNTHLSKLDKSSYDQGQSWVMKGCARPRLTSAIG